MEKSLLRLCCKVQHVETDVGAEIQIILQRAGIINKEGRVSHQRRGNPFPTFTTQGDTEGTPTSH